MHPVLAATTNRCLVAEGLRETREEARHGGRIRVDGRLPSAARPTSLVLRRTRKAASAVLSLGRTQILAEVVGELVHARDVCSKQVESMPIYVAWDARRSRRHTPY